MWIHRARFQDMTLLSASRHDLAEALTGYDQPCDLDLSTVGPNYVLADYLIDSCGLRVVDPGDPELKERLRRAISVLVTGNDSSHDPHVHAAVHAIIKAVLDA